MTIRSDITRRGMIEMMDDWTLDIPWWQLCCSDFLLHQSMIPGWLIVTVWLIPQTTLKSVKCLQRIWLCLSWCLQPAGWSNIFDVCSMSNSNLPASLDFVLPRIKPPGQNQIWHEVYNEVHVSVSHNPSWASLKTVRTWSFLPKYPDQVLHSQTVSASYGGSLEVWSSLVILIKRLEIKEWLCVCDKTATRDEVQIKNVPVTTKTRQT